MHNKAEDLSTFRNHFKGSAIVSAAELIYIFKDYNSTYRQMVEASFLINKLKLALAVSMNSGGNSFTVCYE